MNQEVAIEGGKQESEGWRGGALRSCTDLGEPLEEEERGQDSQWACLWR